MPLDEEEGSLLLERVEPSLARGERIRLDPRRTHYAVGRAESNDVRLYTASASRRHAVISRSASGHWEIRPCEGRQIEVDGEPNAGPIALEVGLNVLLGGDHLRCVEESFGATAISPKTVRDGGGDVPEQTPGGPSRTRPSTWTVLGALAIGLLLLRACLAEPGP